VLFIAESAPARNKRGKHSYFYLPEDDSTTQHPSVLFWEMAKVLGLARACGTEHELARSATAVWKPQLLAEFSVRGLWLLDTAKCAVNGLREGRRRDAALTRCAASWLRQELEELEPERIVLIKANVYRLLRPLLEEWGWGGRILNQAGLPHPAFGNQRKFRERLRAVVEANPSLFGV
jgi:hypothetical protein